MIRWIIQWPEMTSFHVLLYRMYFVLTQSATEGVLRRWPRTGRGLDQLKRLVQRHFRRKTQAWVRRLFATQRPFIIAEVHHQKAAEQITDWLDEYQYGAQWNIPEEKFPRRLFAWPTEQNGEAWMPGTHTRPVTPAALCILTIATFLQDSVS